VSSIRCQRLRPSIICFSLGNLANGTLAVSVDRHNGPVSDRHRQSHHSLGHRIVVIIVPIAQLAEAEQQMHDQAEDDLVPTIGRPDSQMGKTRREPPLEGEARKQLLEDDEPGQRC
jgi:hypothetical protein